MAFKQHWVGTKGPRVSQENVPHTFTPAPQAWPTDTRQNGSFPAVYTKSWPCKPNVTAQIKTHQTRRCFYNLANPMQTSASIAFLRQQWHLVWSFAAAHHLQGFDILCVQLCSSAYLACKELVFELLLFSYQIKAVWLVSFDHWHYLTRKSLEINISFKGNMIKISTSAQTRSKPNNARVTERSAKSVATVPVSSAFHNQLILVSYLLHVAYASLGETRDQTMG